ncbi:MAG: SIS domain-containing protein [bacterium]
MHEWSTENLLHRAREIALWEAEAVYSVAGQVSESLIPILEALIQCQGHVLVTGVGTSRFVAERMAHLLSSCGTPAMYVSAPDCLHGGIGTVTAQNVVLIISKGGQSVEINQFAGLAKARGAKIIAMTETFHSPLAEIADFIYKIIVPRDVDPFGMVAMGTSLVYSMAGDVLCRLLMEVKGYSYEDFKATHPGGAVGQKIRNVENAVKRF